MNQFDDDLRLKQSPMPLKNCSKVMVQRVRNPQHASSRQSNGSSSSEREKMLATHNKNSAKCNFELSKKKQDTEETEAQE